MYNLIGCISSYFDTTESFCFYCKEETASFNAGAKNINVFKSLKYKEKLFVSIFAIGANENISNTRTAVLLK